VNTRERFQCVMNHKEVDQPPLYEFLGFWSDTIGRWHREGLPIGETVKDYFGLEEWQLVPVDFGPIPRFVTRTLEEDERSKIFIDELGVKSKVIKIFHTSRGIISYPCGLREDAGMWLCVENMKTRFDPKDLRRYPKNWSRELFDYYNNEVDHPLGMGWYPCAGVFGPARWWIGDEKLMTAFYKSPDRVHDLFKFITDFQMETAIEAVRNVKIDFVSFWEDFAYSTGPLVSPRIFREFILPHYKKMIDFFKGYGIDIFMVDCDGNFNVLIPLFLEAGVNTFFPLEAAAGMDAVSLKKEYGEKIRLIGNIDKRALAAGQDAIDKEVNGKIPYLLEQGGYIPSVDHLVPSDVPFENYAHYIKLVKESFKIR